MRWLLQNIRRRARFAFTNPRYAASSIIRELAMADERFIGEITNKPARQIRAYMDEPISTPEFAELLYAAHAKFRKFSIGSADLFAKKVLMQYAAVRALAPECVVETGVANGVSSAYLLLAFHKNHKGRLHSIGLDDGDSLPPGEELGWLVPTWLRGRWLLHKGDSRELLPSVLLTLGGIDIFVHDSLHTYDHMLWEFRTAHGHLRSGGLLISDDATWNPAFLEFTREVAGRKALIMHGVGFLQKEAS